MTEYQDPAPNKQVFTCPFCGVLAYFNRASFTIHATSSPETLPIPGVFVAQRCLNCREDVVWRERSMIWPLNMIGPLPNPDLPDDIKTDYEEARSIAGRSPRGAAALLRLACEKLTAHLGAEGETINKRIGDLVKKGLDPRVQKTLDSLRIVGNEQVHPGELDIRAEPELLETLFWLVNVVADDMISKPARIDAIYARLPSEKLKGIEKRDKSVTDTGRAGN